MNSADQRNRKELLAEKKATPLLSVLKHRDLSRRIAELTETLEELRSEKAMLLSSLEYAEDTGLYFVGDSGTVIGNRNSYNAVFLFCRNGNA